MKIGYTQPGKLKFIIYPSDWAAQSAIQYYHADPSKVKVVLYGANLDLFTNQERYKEMALNSYFEYQNRLNWSVAGKTIKELLCDL